MGRPGFGGTTGVRRRFRFMNADWEAVVVGVVIAFPIRLYRMGPKNRGADGVEIGGKLLVGLGIQIFLIAVTEKDPEKTFSRGSHRWAQI